ncbi:hypothetical protein VTO42DRAFT_1070 [Malbranchea cinnamomea]
MPSPDSGAVGHPFPLTDLDRQILAQTDEEYQYHSWNELKELIANNKLDALKRKPSDLRRYINWTSKVKAKYSSITNYICLKRLHWPLDRDPATQCHNQTPFADPRDYKILRNDWPYGVEPGIVHLCVWVKNYIPVKPETGELTPESHAMIDVFVKKTFVERLKKESIPNAEDRVIWFKNWTALQSVRALEHVHILLRDVPEQFIVEWTGETAPVQDDVGGPVD